jgi:hypothetical protein
VLLVDVGEAAGLLLHPGAGHAGSQLLLRTEETGGCL